VLNGRLQVRQCAMWAKGKRCHVGPMIHRVKVRDWERHFSPYKNTMVCTWAHVARRRIKWCVLNFRKIIIAPLLLDKNNSVSHNRQIYNNKVPINPCIYMHISNSYYAYIILANVPVRCTDRNTYSDSSMSVGHESGSHTRNSPPPK
jgi:hypothetical protein